MCHRLLLRLEVGYSCMECIFKRIRLVDLVRHDIDLLHRIVDSVYADIQPHVKEMLMVGRIQQWRNHPAVLWRLPFVDRAERKNPGELYLELDISVLVEVPEEAVLVILHR